MSDSCVVVGSGFNHSLCHSFNLLASFPGAGFFGLLFSVMALARQLREDPHYAPGREVLATKPREVQKNGGGRAELSWLF